MSHSKAAAKAFFAEGQNVLVSIDLRKEKGFIIEKKEKIRNNAKPVPLYKVKTITGITKWVTDIALEPLHDPSAQAASISSSLQASAKIVLSDALKEILLKDKNRVALAPKVKVPAEKIFDMYLVSQSALKPHSVEEIKEAVLGLKEMFVFFVHTSLLAKEERLYYEKNLYSNPDKVLKAYGIGHILRMLASFHRIQQKLQATPDVLEHIIEYLKSFTSFLETNCAQFA